MEQFMRKFEQLNGKMAIISLEHYLFGKQVFKVDKLKTINDKRIGVILKGQEKYVSKQDAKTSIQNGVHIISDGKLKIIVNEL